MPTPSRQRSVSACGNCAYPAKKLGRLVVRLRSGERRMLLVCPFCYLQLASHAMNRSGR
jgi:hypothetical protein